MIAFFTWLTGTRFGRMVATAGAIVIGALALIGKGRRDAERAEERERLKDYAKTRKRADAALRAAEADTRPPDERLNEHGKLRRDINKDK